MSTKKPDLYTIEKALIDHFSEESYQGFLDRIGQGKPPSLALQEFMLGNQLSSLDTGIIIDLLRRAYPDIDIPSISGRIHDAGYDGTRNSDMSDAEFDALITRVVDSPPEW